MTYLNRSAVVILMLGLAWAACDPRTVPARSPDGAVARDSTDQDGSGHTDQLTWPDEGGSVAPCNNNSHCPKTEYCHLDQGCLPVGGKIGRCKKRPQNCTSVSDPVCGCDGKTHGNACAARWAGSNIAYKGKCQTCVELSTSYTKAVQQANKCCATCSKPQCTYLVKTNLICPCYTYIEVANTAALTSMQQALARWTTQQCTEKDCGLSCGPKPKGAHCGGTPAMGTCKNTS